MTINLILGNQPKCVVSCKNWKETHGFTLDYNKNIAMVDLNKNAYIYCVPNSEYLIILNNSQKF